MKGNNKIFKRLVIFSITMILFLTAVVFFPSVSAADHYISPGDDIQAIIDMAGNYDTIHFSEGTYNPSSTININKPLTLLGPQSGVDPRPFSGSTRTPGDSSTEAIINGNGIYRIFYIDADDVIIGGLEIHNGTGDLIRQSNAYSGTIIKNCIVYDAIDDDGIQLKNCNDGSIEYNYVFDVAQDGANFADSTNCRIYRNEITSSTSENGAIFVYNSNDITIEGNYIHHTSSNNGIKLYTNIGDIDIINNLITDNEWEIKSKHHEYSGNAILGYKYTETGSTVRIHHNTVSNNNVAPTSPYHYNEVGFGNGICIATVVSYSGLYYDGFLDIQNNIITNNGLPSYGWGVISKLYYGCLGPTPSHCLIDYNDFYNNGAGICSGTFCPVGVNNIYGDPEFIGGGDYNLAFTSPCKDSASLLGIFDDIVGTIRDANPDIGAYEYFTACIPDITVNPGYDPEANCSAASRWRNFRTDGSGWELAVGDPNAIGTYDPGWSNLDFVYSGDYYFSPAGPNMFTFTYDAITADQTVEANVDGGLFSETQNNGNLGSLDYLQIDVVGRFGQTVKFQNVVLTVDSTSYDLCHFEAGGWNTWYIDTLDLTDGFSITGEVWLIGQSAGQEHSKIEICAGSLAPPCTPVCMNIDTLEEYCFIQDAIDEADPCNTIEVYPGTHVEQLEINKDLSLIGQPGAIIQAPDVMKPYTISESSKIWYPIIFTYGGIKTGTSPEHISGTETISVHIEGFQIDGVNNAYAHPDRTVAILYRNVVPGTHPSLISNNEISNMYDADGMGDGPETFGILIYGDSEVTVLNNIIQDFSRGGIGVIGDDGGMIDPYATIEGNIVYGNGLETETGWWAENGIQISNGAGGIIAENDVYDCQVNNPSWVSTGIMVYDAQNGVEVLDNNVENCDTGISVNSPSFDIIDGNTVTFCNWDALRLGWPTDNTTVTNNILTNSLWGIYNADASDNVIEHNTIQHNEYGIAIDGDSHRNIIQFNDILDNIVYGVYLKTYYTAIPSGNHINYNNIVGNGVSGVENVDLPSVVDATCNWWGDISGPSGEGLGMGDSVSANITFIPWLDDVYLYGDCNLPYYLDITVIGNGDAVVDPDEPYYLPGDVVELTPVADPGWYFIGWSGPNTGDLIETGYLTWTIVMDEDKELTAEFSDECMDPVFVDDNFNYATPGFNIDHFVSIQDAVDRVCPYGTVYVYNGSYYEDVDVYKHGVLITGVYEPPLQINGQTCALVYGEFSIEADDVSVYQFVFKDSEDGAVQINAGVNADGIQVNHNKFLLECNGDAIGVINGGSGFVDARYNYWDMSNGPSGGVGDPVTGRIASGYGVEVGSNVRFDPWAGVSAIAQASATSVETGTAVMFDSIDSFSMHLDGTSNTYTTFWDFDDGTYSSDDNPSHVFSAPGTYTVSLRVQANDPGLLSGFMFDWDYITIEVYGPGAPLIANADGGNLGGYETTIGETVELFGSASGGTPPYTYHWALGDAGSSTSQNPTVIFDEAGTHTIVLTVTDSELNSATDSAEVVVYGVDELLVSISVPMDGMVDSAIVFRSSVSGGVAPYSYHWDFGDGVSSTDRHPTHSYDAVGEYTVTLVVTDDAGHSDEVSSVVSIAQEDETASIVQVSGGLFVNAVIRAGDNDADWSIHVDGPVFMGGDVSGSIPASAEQTVGLPLTVGFGKVTVTVTAELQTETYTAFLLGPFFLNLL